MNTYTLTLTSLSSTAVQYLSTIDLVDHTILTLNIAGLDKKFTPLYLKINWGEGASEIFDNNVLATYSPGVLYDPLLSSLYTHEYFPSEFALYKLLSAQVYVQYSTDGFYYALIPIRIRTMDYFESIGDLELINTNILPVESNASEHQLKTSAEGYIIELRGS